MVLRRGGNSMVDLEKQATPTQESIVRRMKNRDWFDANFKEVQGKYAEKWIAVAGEAVVAFGDDPDAVKMGIKGEFSALEIVLVRVPAGEISQPV
jgi:hypothetical protein